MYYEGVTVTYTINSEKSAWIYANISDYKKNLISDSLVASAIKSSSKELNSTDATNRGIIEPLAQEKIQEALNQKYGDEVVFINKVVIANTDFEESYNQAIADKLFSSRKAEAKAFKNWVTHDVLPSIRKNGGYIIGQEELKGEDKEKLEEQIRQLAKQVNAYKEDGNLWMKMYFDVQTDYINAVEKIYGKKKADIDAPENSSEKEYVVTPEGWILPKSLMGRDED